MRILLTGASSFTGFHFATALADAGHDVSCTLTRSSTDYTGLRAERIRRLSARVQFVERAGFGQPQFLELLDKGSFEVP